MENRQIVEYIQQGLQAGHSETAIRDHMLANGWLPTQADIAFQEFKRQSESGTNPAAASKNSKRRARFSRLAGRPNVRKSKVRWFKLAAGAIVLAVVAGVCMYELTGPHHKMAVAAGPPALTAAQKQSSDVITIAGAIVQFEAANDGAQPTRAVVEQGGSLILCATTCDSSTQPVAPFLAYDNSDVSFVPYTPNLVVPDTHSLYVVPGATCAGNPRTITSSTNAKSMVALYATAAQNGMQQRCVQM